MAEPLNDLDALTARLLSVLDHHRQELTRLPGVIGTGVGLSTSNSTDAAAVAIQILVSPGTARGTVARRAAEIVGREHPLDIVSMPLPQADAHARDKDR